MKKTISALVAVSALAVAAPAMAQGYGGGYYGGGYYGGGYGGGHMAREIERLDNRIDRARYNRTISPREAHSLKAQVSQLRYTLRTYMRDGRLSHWERSSLDSRIDRVQRQLRNDRRDWDRRPY